MEHWRSLRSIFSSKISTVLNYGQHDECLFKLQYHIESFKLTGVRSIPWCPPAVGGFAPDRVPKAPSSKRTSPPVALRKGGPREGRGEWGTPVR